MKINKSKIVLVMFSLCLSLLMYHLLEESAGQTTLQMKNHAVEVQLQPVLKNSVVVIKDFTLSSMPNGIEISWCTVQENQNLGFNLFRSDDGQNYMRINQKLIPGAGSSDCLLQYSVLDRNVQKRVGFSYKLISMDLNGKSQVFGPKKYDNEALFSMTMY